MEEMILKQSIIVTINMMAERTGMAAYAFDTLVEKDYSELELIRDKLIIKYNDTIPHDMTYAEFARVLQNTTTFDEFEKGIIALGYQSMQECADSIAVLSNAMCIDRTSTLVTGCRIKSIKSLLELLEIYNTHLSNLHTKNEGYEFASDMIYRG